MENISQKESPLSPPEETTVKKQNSDYSELLNKYGVQYTATDYYWQVGELNSIRGWILHITSIYMQLDALLNQVIPFLLLTKTPFKIIRNLYTAESLLNGNLGYVNLGKLIKIYPRDDRQAVILAKKLIDLTKPFQGPAVPTDRHLGSVVYTSYGSFNPSTNNKDTTLIPDIYPIPFQLPKHLAWPFGEITSHEVPINVKLLNKRYYPTKMLKNDARGAVMKGIGRLKAFNIKPCLIKQGLQNMAADDFRRDIRDRLLWQYNIHRKLSDHIPLPKAYDYFEHDENAYIIMEYLQGMSLNNWIGEIFCNHFWQDLTTSKKLAVLDSLHQTLDIIHNLHQKGYVHRDINPGNFMIIRNKKVFIIDMELCWPLNSENNDPPFQWGSFGYMSPQQSRKEIPTVQDDIFSLGCVMFFLFTNLHPIKLIYQSKERLYKSIFFLTGNLPLATLIINCVNKNPIDRPCIDKMLTEVDRYATQIRVKNKKINTTYHSNAPSIEIVSETICKGLNGIVDHYMLNRMQYWFSKMVINENQIANNQFGTATYPGWYIGVSGPLWLLSRATICGCETQPYISIYTNNWQYLLDSFFRQPTDQPSGLYKGGAGIGLTLAEGLNSGLLSADQNNIERLYKCFSQIAPGLDLPFGIAGQGMALLSCAKWADNDSLDYLLIAILEKILGAQQRDGSWGTQACSTRIKENIDAVKTRTVGIILFLLSYLYEHSEKDIVIPLKKALQWLMKTESKKNVFGKKSPTTPNFLIVLAFIKAYELFKDPAHRQFVEDQLNRLPTYTLSGNFSLDGGMAALGELSLEAFRVFHSDMHQKRADWIANVFIHTMQQWDDNKGGYWITDNSSFPTADLFTGTSGIIHFLLRYLYPQTLSHPLLPGIKE